MSEQIGKSWAKIESALEIVFGDYLQIRQLEDELADVLLVERTEQQAQLESLTRQHKWTGRNVLVIGRRGVGKSTFVHEFIRRQETAGKKEIHPVLIDLAPYGSTHEGIVDQKIRLAKAVHEYLRVISAPGLGSIPTEIDSDLYPYSVSAALQAVPLAFLRDTKAPLLVVIVDDVDYCTKEEQEKVLQMAIPYFRLPQAAGVFCARPPALRLVESAKDTRLRNLFSLTSRILLPPLPPRTVLGRRLALLCPLPGNLRLLYTELVNRALSAFQRWAGERGFMADDSHLISAYPFTLQQEAIMLSVTNGNIRDLLPLAKCLLWEIVQATGMRPANESEAERGVPLDTSAIFRALRSTNCPASCRAVNIHWPRGQARKGSDVGAGATRTVMEFLLFSDRIGKAEMRELAELGLSQQNVQEALQAAYDHELIEDKLGLINGATGGFADNRFVAESWSSSPLLNGQYKLTPKGRFYLSTLANWRLYAVTFGVQGRSLLDMKGFIGRTRVMLDVVEVLSQLAALSHAKGTFAVDRQALWSFFNSNYGGAYLDTVDDPDFAEYITVPQLSQEQFNRIISACPFMKAVTVGKPGHWDVLCGQLETARKSHGVGDFAGTQFPETVLAALLTKPARASQGS